MGVFFTSTTVSDTLGLGIILSGYSSWILEIRSTHASTSTTTTEGMRDLETYHVLRKVQETKKRKCKIKITLEVVSAEAASLCTTSRTVLTSSAPSL